jgi:zinc protease
VPRLTNGRAALLVGSLLVAALAGADHPRAESTTAVPALPVRQVRLANGLTVVLAPDRSVSSVRVVVRYRGGAADEPADRAGFTHLVERLLANGTVHTKAGEHEQRIDGAGGWTTSATTLDDLTLSTEVPPGALALALWLEAERMAGLADGITEAGLAEARDTISAEYRSAYVDEAYAAVTRTMREALWPAGHGNRHDVLVDAAALERASLADVRRFVRERLAPRRATIAIIGSFSPADAERLAQRYFAWIPGRPATAADGAALASTVESLGTPSEHEVADIVDQIVVAYRVPVDRASTVQLQLVARLLAGSPTARLERAFVDSGRARDARVELFPHARGGELVIHVTPATGADTRRLAADVRSEVASFGVVPPSSELVAQIGAGLDRERLLALESLAGRAATLDDWRGLASLDAHVTAVQHERESVRPAQLQAFIRTWLAETHAVTVIAGTEAF